MSWKQTWFEAQKSGRTISVVPTAFFRPFNIDAKINAAYIVIGLLYGARVILVQRSISVPVAVTIRIVIRQTPAEFLEQMIGYDRIPDHWKQGIEKWKTWIFNILPCL